MGRAAARVVLSTVFKAQVLKEIISEGKIHILRGRLYQGVLLYLDCLINVEYYIYNALCFFILYLLAKSFKSESVLLFFKL